ncbi:response regulator [bacterium]|nr:response regulator [bacterium]
MPEPIRILHLEDDDAAAALVRLELRRNGFAFAVKFVKTAEDYIDALDTHKPDLILSDYHVPEFDGPAALAFRNEKCPETPFIFVTGTLGEEDAVETLKQGATDYVLKDRMHRLAPAIARAIEERKNLESRRQLERQFLAAQKMDALGRLAGGVAHDFNNLLMAIMSFSDLALLELPNNHPIRPHLDDIQTVAERAAALNRQLLAFSKRQIAEPRVLDLNRQIRELEKMLRRVIGEHIELRCRLAEPLGPVFLDPGQLEQVIVNLVVNAGDAMPTGGRLTIETANVELDGEYQQDHPYSVTGSHVRLSVSDTGMGMTREIQARIFEPFFTTKEKGRGTGLGLSTCYGIVKQNNGSIEVYSEPGSGTTFKIYFPRTEGAAEEAAKPAKSETVLRGTETILVAEDEPFVRASITGILRSLGYRVFEAMNGEEALLEARKRLEAGEEIDLLLTDVIMPQMGGRELSERLSAVSPGARVVFMSGYTEGAIDDRGLLAKNVNFLQKPVRMETLAKKIREALDT